MRATTVSFRRDRRASISLRAGVLGINRLSNRERESGSDSVTRRENPAAVPEEKYDSRDLRGTLYIGPGRGSLATRGVLDEDIPTSGSRENVGGEPVLRQAF